MSDLAVKRYWQSRNHPQKGDSIKVSPIRRMEDIARIKEILCNQPRNLCLFTLGINTGFRASELLSIKIKQVMYLKSGDQLEIKQSKSNKYRTVILNENCIASITNWLKAYNYIESDNPLFSSRNSNSALTVSYVSRLVKKWCFSAGLKGNFGSHTLRKTWGYQNRVINNTPLPILMKAYGHSSEEQTLRYICILDDEISAIYKSLEL